VNFSKSAMSWIGEATHLSCSFYDPLCDFRLTANAYRMVRADLVDELIFRHGSCVVVYKITLCFEGVHGVLADIFEDQ